MANAVVGRVLLIPKGDYASGTTYNMLDLVRYNNKSWVCKQNCTGQTPQEDSYWQVMASDGAEGGYCYIRYSANSDGTGLVVTPTANTIYIGFYTGDSETAPTDKASYTWSKYAGLDGIGIVSIVKTDTQGVIDTYAITYSDNTTSTYTVTNGTDGQDGVSASASVSKVGKVATITCQTGSEEPTTATISDGEDGEDGASINLAGEWYVGTEYVNNGSRIDIVSKSGNSYGCLQSHIASNTNQPPNSSCWQLLAQKGADGQGSGDMLKSTYDTNGNGMVDMAESLNGLSASILELNYMDGATGNVQEQLDDKLETETDPTVPSWAKQAEKPSYTASEVGAATEEHTHDVSDITGKPFNSVGSGGLKVTSGVLDVDPTKVPLITGNIATANRLSRINVNGAGAGNANKWTKVGSFTASGNYIGYSAILSVTDKVYNTNTFFISINFRTSSATNVVEEGSLGFNSFGNNGARYASRDAAPSFKLVYTAPLFELWFNPQITYLSPVITVINEIGIGPNLMTYYSNQPYQDTAPTGTVLVCTPLPVTPDQLPTASSSAKGGAKISGTDGLTMDGETLKAAVKGLITSENDFNAQTVSTSKAVDSFILKEILDDINGGGGGSTIKDMSENVVATTHVIDTLTGIAGNTLDNQLAGAKAVQEVNSNLNNGNLIFAVEADGKLHAYINTDEEVGV